MKCITDHVPVGVIREAENIGRQRLYKVLGLATPVDWINGYFILEHAAPASPLEAVVRAEFDAEIAANVPGTDYDARRRAVREIVARQGQSDFRGALINAYRGRCAVTHCTVKDVLEAAHLRPYRGPDSNTVTNGLLLRADIHTLLDLRLLAPDPSTRTITISSLLTGTQYEEISGAPLAEPVAVSQRPSSEALETVWHEFQQAEKSR
jgi:predicted restriction endonuclease